MNASPKKPLIRYFPVALFLGFVLMMTTCFTFTFSSRSGQGVKRDGAPVADLPENATDVNFFIPGLMGKDIYMDFKTDEEGYMLWVESHEQIELEKRSEGGFAIERYNFDLKRGQAVQVEDGLLFAWTEDAKGVFLGFDRDTGRAFFHSRAE